MNRRQFLKGSALTAVLAGLNLPVLAENPGKIRISVQLYSVREDCAKDFDAALAGVAKMGFEGVEFAGYHNYSGKAVELRKRLDDLNLKAAGSLAGGMGFLSGDELKKTIEFNQAIGCKFLGCAGDGDFNDPEKSKVLAETFNKLAEILKPLGMACGYHNHAGEFSKNGGKTYWDLFAERTGKDVILWQDCGWTAAAGVDPAEMIRRYPGRTRITHLKPMVVARDKETRKEILGQDSVDWAGVVAACRTVGGTEWATVEQESYPDGRSPMECTAASLAGLKRVLAG